MCFWRYAYFSHCQHQQFILQDYCDRVTLKYPSIFPPVDPHYDRRDRRVNYYRPPGYIVLRPPALHQAYGSFRYGGRRSRHRRTASFPDSCLANLNLYKAKSKDPGASMDKYTSTTQLNVVSDCSNENRTPKAIAAPMNASRTEGKGFNISGEQQDKGTHTMGDSGLQLDVDETGSPEKQGQDIVANLETRGRKENKPGSRTVSNSSNHETVAVASAMFPPLQDNTNSSVHCTISMRSASGTMSQVSWAQIVGGSPTIRPDPTTHSPTAVSTRPGMSGSDAAITSTIPHSASMRSPAETSIASPLGKAMLSEIPIIVLPEPIDILSFEDLFDNPADTIGARRLVQESTPSPSVQKHRAETLSSKHSDETSRGNNEEPESGSPTAESPSSPVDPSSKPKGRAPLLATAQRAAMRELKKKESIVGLDSKATPRERTLRPAVSCSNLRRSGAAEGRDNSSPTNPNSPLVPHKHNLAATQRLKSPVRLGNGRDSPTKIGQSKTLPRKGASLSPQARALHTPRSSISSIAGAGYTTAQQSPKDESSPNSFVTALETLDGDEHPLLLGSPARDHRKPADIRTDASEDLHKTIRPKKTPLQIPGVGSTDSGNHLKLRQNLVLKIPGNPSTVPDDEYPGSSASKDGTLAALSKGSHIPVPSSIASSRKNSVASVTSTATTRWKPELERLDSQMHEPSTIDEHSSRSTSGTVPFPPFDHTESGPPEHSEFHVQGENRSTHESENSKRDRVGKSEPREAPPKLSRADSAAKRKESIKEIKKFTQRRASSATVRERNSPSQKDSFSHATVLPSASSMDKAISAIGEYINEADSEVLQQVRVSVEERNYVTEVQTDVIELPPQRNNSGLIAPSNWSQIDGEDENGVQSDTVIINPGPSGSVWPLDAYQSEISLKLMKQRESLETPSSELRPDAPAFVPGQAYTRPPLPMDWQFPTTAVSAINSINAAPTFASPAMPSGPNVSPLYSKGKKKAGKTKAKNKNRSDTITSYSSGAQSSAQESLVGALQGPETGFPGRHTTSKWKQFGSEDKFGPLSPRTYSQSYGGFRKRPFYDRFRRFDYGHPMQGGHGPGIGYPVEQQGGHTNFWTTGHQMPPPPQEKYMQQPMYVRDRQPVHVPMDQHFVEEMPMHQVAPSYRSSAGILTPHCLPIAPSALQRSPITLRGGGEAHVQASVETSGPREYVGYGFDLDIKPCRHMRVEVATENINGQCEKCYPDDHKR